MLASSRCLQLPDRFRIHEWSIMNEFAEAQHSIQVRQELLETIHGAGAFRMFRSTIRGLGIEKSWYRFREEALQKSHATGPRRRSFRTGSGTWVRGTEGWVFVPIAIDKYVQLHVQANPDEDPSELLTRLRGCVSDSLAGARCSCGAPISGCRVRFGGIRVFHLHHR